MQFCFSILVVEINLQVSDLLQNVNADLQESLMDRERLKSQVQGYIGDVKRTEEVLAAKVSNI